MKLRNLTVLAIGVLSLAMPIVSNAALPTCVSASSDSDGDGFGWENNSSCRVASSGGSKTTVCNDPSSDPDGDGFGWENNASCVVKAGDDNGRGSTNGGPSSSSTPTCSSANADPDGDGYGWENNKSCIVKANTPTSSGGRPVCTSANADPDGDGYGWENNKTCVVGNIETEQPQIKPFSSVYPYRANSQFASVLKKCASVKTREQSCKLNQLPFIGHTNANPTVDNIMDRVLVTHEWMGQRFERLLYNSPDSIRKLFRSVAVIAIGSDVRPSSYWGMNGLISLDPYFLWMTVDEKRTISPDPDFRAEYGKELKFARGRGLMNPNGSFLSYPSLSGNNERSFDDLVKPAVALLFHELGHAVDFAPPWTLAGMNFSSSFVEALEANEANWLSPRLQAIYPNQSALMYGLASVRFRDAQANEIEKNTLSVDVGKAFANDGAMRMYSYSTIREDYANLLEVAMMKYHYNTSLAVYFYDKPTDSDPSCRVGWGVKNRLANPSVLPRAYWAVTRAIESNSSLERFFEDGVGVETSYLVGEDLCAGRAKGLGFSSPMRF